MVRHHQPRTETNTVTQRQLIQALQARRAALLALPRDIASAELARVNFRIVRALLIL